MTSSIRQFWTRLKSPVHPDDVEVFGSNPHTYNLDFPPPAFIGDVDNAPVVILMLNGGYDREKTQAEFPDPKDHTDYLEWLRGERTEIPQNLSPYYTQQKVFPWVREGKAVIVNAVAYRSPKLSEEPQNRQLAKLLPSAAAHHRWLRKELLPEVQNGKRCLVVHRWSLWNISPDTIGPIPNVHFAKNPRFKYLANDLLGDVSAWLNQQKN